MIRELGSDQFPRVRAGIGRPRGQTVDYVLSAWDAAERALADEMVEAAADAVLLAVRRGIDVAMNEYNSWSPASRSADDGGEPRQEQRKENGN